MRPRCKYLTLTLIALTSSSPANSECFGEAEYRVCTESYTHSNGDLSVRSYDTEGNSYSLDTTTRDLPGGGREVTSEDSDGNSYTLKSWSDSSGFHSVDSDGNRCTITHSGVMIGCGQ